jgi:glycosyltransferase-like protein
VRIALLTYSTRPRGGVVHTLAVAEALADAGTDVHVYALGTDGFFRPTTVACTLIAPPPDTGSLSDKVFASIDALATALAADAPGFDLLHAEDCISARAATRVRDQNHGPPVIRTVHHVDDFTTPALIECQRRAIEEPDHVLVVSEHWRRILREDYGIDAAVVRNGVDPDHFPAVGPERREQLRATIGTASRFLFLAVGGIEPRKGSKTLFAALGLLRERGTDPIVAIVGGHSFRDYEEYRQQALAMLPIRGLALGEDIIQLGTVPDETLRAWYRSADALAFPSMEEGFGLAPLEALAADLPVVASDLPVFKEFLTDGQDALLPAAGDPRALADAMDRVMTDSALRTRLATNGRAVLPRFTWQATAAQHAAIYRAVTSSQS